MRRFIVATVLALFVSGCVSSVNFQSASLQTETAPPQKLRGYLAKPDGAGPFPAVVLLHHCGGVTPTTSQEWPRFFAKNGYVALTVDTFGSRNAGRCPEAMRLSGAMVPDAYGALDYLATLPEVDSNRIAVMGFSLGAFAIPAFTGSGTTLTSPGGKRFKSGIAVYGSCSFKDKTAVPVLQVIGSKDYNSKACPKESDPSVTTEIISGATHAFDQSDLSVLQMVPGGHMAIYSASATQRARELILDFLNRNMGR